MTATTDPLEQRLRALGRQAADGAGDGAHVGEPLLALLRSGDHSDDIADAIAHVARCADCRARLVAGDVSHRNVVVMAIEAPRASMLALTRAAEATSARLVGRGEGRWTAVVDADNADRLRGELVKGVTSVVSRLAETKPLQVPREEPDLRGRMGSVADVPTGLGTGAAEIEAWAQIRRSPRKKVAGPGPGWVLFAVAAVAAAVTIAYLLAIR